MVSKIKILLFTALMLMTLASCDDTPIGSPICTAEFVTINLKVTDAAGQPVENADINITHSVSGDTLQVCESFECADGKMGNYTLFHDGLMEEVSFEGEAFIVSGTAEEGSFREEFIFAKDECHVFKKSGPESVTIN